MMGDKPEKSWGQAEKRWLQEMGHKRSICNDIIHFEWLEPYFYKYSLNEITKDIIEDTAKIREGEGVKPASVNRLLALIRAVLNRACKQWEWIDKVPVIRMRKEDNARIIWLTREQASKLLATLPPHLKAMARFSLATGLRQGNVKNLRWEQIDMATRHMIVHPEDSKSKKAISVPLNDDAIEVIRGQIGKHEKFVFTYKGKPIIKVNGKAWQKAMARAGIENFRWHDLRHTWASWHVQSGTSLQELFELGGWASFEMVLRYAHLSSSHLKAAAQRISGAKMVKRDLKVVKN